LGPDAANFAIVHRMSSAGRTFHGRVVVLGASNATKGISLIVETAERLLGGPLDVHAAIGHGRSYGQKSFLIARSIQGVLNCGLWERIGWQDQEGDANEPAGQSAHEEEPPLYALLTDVGNDIMYGVEPDLIIEWVEKCVSRLKQLNARIVMTGLPMAVLDRIGEYQYLFFRTLFFPKNPHSLEETADRARRVQAGLQELAAKHDVPFIEQKREWYGIDPIHLTQQSRAKAWAIILSHWLDRPLPLLSSSAIAQGSVRRFLAIRTRLPEHWWLFNRLDLGGQQPCTRLPSGTWVSMY
jgi:hypothetical protein